MGCKKAQGFLEENAWQVDRVADAAKERQGPKEALALARSVGRILVARGKKVTVFDMKTDPPDEATLLAHLLGPTGNLRAPTLRKGDMLLVGFSAEAYRTGLND